MRTRALVLAAVFAVLPLAACGSSPAPVVSFSCGIGQVIMQADHGQVLVKDITIDWSLGQGSDVMQTVKVNREVSTDPVSVPVAQKKGPPPASLDYNCTVYSYDAG